MDVTTPADAIDQALEGYSVLVREDEELSAELLASAETFFGSAAPAGAPREVLLAARRHLEWFILERHSPSLFGTPVERLLDRWTESVEPEIARHASALLDSFSGLFEVGEVRAGEGAWLRDVAGFGSYAVLEPEASYGLRTGDLLVGRLFPVGDGLHRVSGAAGFFRDPTLLEALERDLERTRAERGHNVLHLSQCELERMFWVAGRQPLVEDTSARARTVLAAGGVDPLRIEQILGVLRAVPYDPDRLVPGAGDPLGEILSELAFDTEVDLEAARRALTTFWARPALAESGPAAAPKKRRPEGRKDARAAVDAFARGRASGVDLELLLRNLERDLELGADASDEPADEGEGEEVDSPVPDFPGVVGALVTEFLWEVGVEGGEETAARYACLDALSDYGQRIGLAEALDENELLRFTTFWIHERGLLTDSGAARDLLDALEAFCAWLETAHGIPLATTFGPTLSRLRESLPRVVELNQSLAQAPDEDTGELYEVRGDEQGRFAGVRDRAGNESPVLPTDASLAERLRPADRLRGRMTERGLAIYRCYPPEAARLL